MPEASVAHWQRISVRYPFEKRDAIGPVDLEIRPGERLLLLGPSGSGKSTLLLTLTGLIPQSIPADIGGRIVLFGSEAADRPPWVWAKDVAQYFQDADQTLCGMRVEDEIAFALENRGLPPSIIAESVRAAMGQVGLPDAWRQRRTATLSGGERQLVALAATLVQKAPLFVADEPTAHLAPQAAKRLHELLVRKGREDSVLIVDHRLDGLIASIDRVVVLGPAGTIVSEGEPRTLFREKRALLDSFGIWCPPSSALDAALAEAGVAAPVPPLSVAEALAHLDPGSAPEEEIAKAEPAVRAFLETCLAPVIPSNRSDETPLARLKAADCAPFLGPVVLRNIDLSIHKGEILGILGANGAGKSTLGACLAGLVRLKAGTRHGAPGALAFQRPENQFVAGTVREEIAGVLPRRMEESDKRHRVSEALGDWGLSGLDLRHPFTLSQGQKRRLVLATLTVDDAWPLLVLDEPTAGLDAGGVAALANEIESLRRSDRAVAVISHDMDFVLRLCTRCIVVGEGRIMADGLPESLLFDSDLLTRAGLAQPSCAPARRWLRQVSSC